ncbi:MAG TPA: hypothetical protein VG328_22645 [Stellaceae bacterium]|jgi:hypothetical protein|nr:hypothetical protein [Stellaceae bacterium]
MAGSQLHLVGGVPLASAEDVFATTSRILGAALPRIPDGEVGRPWMTWFAPIVEENPFLEKTAEEFRPHPGGLPSFRYRLRDGVRPEEVSFTGLRHAAIAIASYGVFKRLKEAGRVRPEAKFQCTLAHPIPVIRRYFPEDLQDAIEPAFEAALLGEVAKIAAAIPHDQLAIQWDCASAVFATLERGEPSRFGRRREEMYGPLAARLARFGRAVPRDIDLLYHFCYGNSNGKHSVEPSSTRDAVIMVNRIAALLGRSRPIQLVHMPVPKSRDDAAYFAPLRDLALAPETTIALGLIHLGDGIAGTERRIAAARKHLSRFALGTECGLAHVSKDNLLPILELHAEIAAAN